MMTCKTFVFLTTTDQWPQSTLGTKLAGQTHQWICSKCRAFRHNDVLLKRILKNYKDQIQQPERET